MGVRSFKELIVWQRSIQLVKRVYKLSEALPQAEQFGLTSQMRRSAVSIPSNISEGSRRGTTKDFLQFLRIADGSSSELETQLIITKEIYEKVDVEEALQHLTEVQKMLGALIQKLSSPTVH